MYLKLLKGTFILCWFWRPLWTKVVSFPKTRIIFEPVILQSWFWFDQQRIPMFASTRDQRGNASFLAGWGNAAAGHWALHLLPELRLQIKDGSKDGSGSGRSWLVVAGGSAGVWAEGVSGGPVWFSLSLCGIQPGGTDDEHYEELYSNNQSPYWRTLLLVSVLKTSVLHRACFRTS